MTENAEALKNHQSNENNKNIKLKERKPNVDDYNSEYENQ
jgi:hypothetical protein